MEDTNVIEIERVLKIAWEKKFYIALILLIFFVVGYYYSFYCVEPMYKSTSTILLVNNSVTEDTGTVTQSDLTLNQKLVSTYTDIITSPKVVGKVISNLKLDMPESELKSAISIKSENGSEMFNISVSNKDAKKAKIINDELLTVFTEVVKETYNIDNVNVMGEAKVDPNPYNINHIRDIGIFLVLAIVVNCGLILMIYLFDTSIKTEEDVEKYVGLNVLTSIPIADPKLVPGMEDNELIAKTDPKSPISEVFRTLRTNIAFTQAGKNIKNILLTSSNPGEGKSWVSSNLAIIFAQANKKTILIDADMRKGRQHYIFEARNRIGLSNYLASSESGDDISEITNYIQTTKIPNLHLMTGGNRPPNPSELLSSDGKMKKLLDTLDLIYDVVIIDGTPSDIVSDSIIISNMVDSVIIVAASKQTKLKSTQKLKRLLDTSNAKIGGVVLNKVAVSPKAYKNKYYYTDSSNTLKSNNEENKKQEIETVEQLIERIKINKEKNDSLINNIPEERELIESNFVNTNYKVEDTGEFKLQINNIGNEINNIKQIFMKVLLDNQNQIKETAINRSEMQVLKEKLDDLKTVCTSLNLIKNDDVAEKIREEIDRLETVYNASQQEDTEYVKNIENKLENMKELYYKSMEFENSVSARTMDKIESVKEVIATLKEYINEKISSVGKSDDLLELKRIIVDIENEYQEKLEERLRRLEEVIIENSKVKKIDEIKDYIQDMQVGYTKELEKKFLALEDSIIENYNSNELALKMEQMRGEYYSQLQDGCIEIQKCIKENNSTERLEDLLNEMQNTNSLELAHKIDEIKDFCFSELGEKLSNGAIDFTSINNKLDEIKEYNSNEFRERLQNIYNLYSSDLDEGVDRIKQYENEKFEELKAFSKENVEEIKNFEKENIDTVKDKLEEMQDRYSIELTAKIDDMQEHYTTKMDQFTEFSEEKFNDVKDKIEEMQDRYSVEMNAKIEDIEEHYTNKLDEITELNQEQINEIKNELMKIQEKYDELSMAITENNTEINSNILENNKELNSIIENNNKELTSIIVDNNKELNLIIEDNNKQLSSIITDNNRELNTMFEDNNKEINTIMENNNKELNTMIQEDNTEQELVALKEKIDNLQQSYTENIQKKIEEIQVAQKENSKSTDIEEVKQEINKLKEIYSTSIKHEFNQMQERMNKQDNESSLSNQINSMKSEFIKIQRKLDEKDNTLEDEIYNMKQELLRLRKELEHKSENVSYKQNEPKQANVYRYNDYDDENDKKSLFGKKDDSVNKDNKKSASSASPFSQILKF